MNRLTLDREHKRTQLNIELKNGFLSLGLCRETPRWMSRITWRPIAYFSPDATPMHAQARGLKGWGG